MTREDHGGNEFGSTVPVAAAADEYTQTSGQPPASATTAIAAGQISGGGGTKLPTATPNAPSAPAVRHPAGGSSRAALQRDYRWRYVELQPLPDSFPDDGGRLRARLRQGWTRGWLVDVGPALNGGGALFEAGPWALVHFEQPGTGGIDEELLPLDILQVLVREGRVDPATAIAPQQRVTGQMRAVLDPPASDHDDKRGGAHG